LEYGHFDSFHSCELTVHQILIPVSKSCLEDFSALKGVLVKGLSDPVLGKGCNTVVSRTFLKIFEGAVKYLFEIFQIYF